ncbi:short-chain alcohol dehydrogenase [Mycobacterium bohemicum DSM 44277]|uniref:Short-chain dehydrogenase n=2 Tax=Mycobacterium bohemicum TaxID=56425 RepID=A0A1X1RBQ5_MYCBE|nr:SDR family oxidoreductase [Mycobacterium bohemicum]MCV6969732.1 SDR family oxidoreductase [Mycobacterium bohemicum]ORV02735.1 short-chain dehydrogenase [Mycobacterium bohemicum]CPR13437.1 short-chain alcohol dehydrogenase [Mycobacterium bohemicum DSM 44277]
MQRFENAVAIVTGGGMGLGEALCEELGRQGATVVVADVDGAAAHQVAGRLKQTGAPARAVRVDVANDAEVARLIEGAVAEYGRVDYMINNAGIAIGGDSRDLSIQQWRRVLDVDLLGVVYGTVHAYRVMARQGHGHIVNVSSLSGLVPQPGNVPYCTSKHGIVGLSLSLRAEGADLGVKVSVACPGDMRTKIYDNMVVVNMPREQVVTLSRRTHYLMPQMSAEAAARAILRGVGRNSPVIVFPAAVRVIWHLYRRFPSLLHRINIHRMRLLRTLRAVPG